MYWYWYSIRIDIGIAMYFWFEQDTQGKLEMEAWLDLANIYSKLESFSDAELCVGKVKSKEFYHPRAWHSTGLCMSSINTYIIYTLFLCLLRL